MSELCVEMSVKYEVVETNKLTSAYSCASYNSQSSKSLSADY